MLPEDRQSVSILHDTPLSDHIRYKQPQIKMIWRLSGQKAFQLVMGCRAYCTSTCIEHKPATVCDSPIHHTQSQSCQEHNAFYLSLLPPPLLSDSMEMNIRTPGCILKLFVFPPPTEANFQRLINLGIILSKGGGNENIMRSQG